MPDDAHHPKKVTPEVDPEFMTMEEVGERFRLTNRQILRLVDQGEFPKALRVSRRIWRFRRREVLAWESGSWVREGDLTARAESAVSSIRQLPEHRPRRRDGAATTPEHQPDGD